MKRYHWVGMALVLGLVSCGKPPAVSPRQDPEPRPVEHPPVACSLAFVAEGLCAEIKWLEGPSADKNSSFRVQFWERQSGKAVDPTGQLSTYLRMTCCGSVTALKPVRTRLGEFRVDSVRFLPGKWELYVQLRRGEAVEKQFTTVDVP